MQNLLTVIKLGGHLRYLCRCLPFRERESSQFCHPRSWWIFSRFAQQFWSRSDCYLRAYKGWETATYSAGEVKNPEKSTAGILIGLFGVIIIYLLANLAYLYILPSSAIATSDRVAADVMMVAVGPLGASIISVIILFPSWAQPIRTCFAPPGLLCDGSGQAVF